jgi:hypothetical protein
MVGIPGVEEIGKTTRSFFDILRESPLSLALVMVIIFLIGLLYYSTAQTLQQRKETADMVIKWQRETDSLMANCVSQDVTKMMLENMNRITETMLANTQGEIKRMQEAINKERDVTLKLIEALNPPKPPTPQSFTQPKPIQFENCDPLGPFCMPL